MRGELGDLQDSAKLLVLRGNKLISFTMARPVASHQFSLSAFQCFALLAAATGELETTLDAALGRHSTKVGLGARVLPLLSECQGGQLWTCFLPRRHYTLWVTCFGVEEAEPAFYCLQSLLGKNCWLLSRALDNISIFLPIKTQNTQFLIKLI